MTINEYQELALRTQQDWIKEDPEAMILDGVIGLCGESGEASEIVKKHLFQDHELDKIHLMSELGDICWYLAITAEGLGTDLETIFQMNIDKLKARYPDGFDSELSIHRKEGDI